MGQPLHPASQKFIQEEPTFWRFRRALRKADQDALDDLLNMAGTHLSAAQYALHALPFEVALLAMVLEEHKEILKLRDKVIALSIKTRGTQIQGL